MPCVRSFVPVLHILLMVGLISFSKLAVACTVCIDVPEKTITDQLIQADVVVLARENPSKAYSYQANEVLKGELSNPEIELFVNSGTRHRLRLNPEHSVVLAYDSEKREWQSVGYATVALQALVKEILTQAPSWKTFDREEKRPAFFLPYLSHSEATVRELAYLEVGQASYDMIRRADPVVPRVQVHAFLSDLQYIEWHSLYILLLGVNAEPDEAKQIWQAMERSARFDLTLNLSAWATALIEADGEKAIDWLATVYLKDPERKTESVTEVVKALSLQGTRQPGFRDRIAQGYMALLDNHPSLAGWAARDLTVWNDWRFADSFVELQKSGPKVEGSMEFSVKYYIKRAGRFSSNL